MQPFKQEVQNSGQVLNRSHFRIFSQPRSFTSQSSTLSPGCLYEKDERAQPGNLHCSDFSVLPPPSCNKCSASHETHNLFVFFSLCIETVKLASNSQMIVCDVEAVMMTPMKGSLFQPASGDGILSTAISFCSYCRTHTVVEVQAFVPLTGWR